MQITYHCGMVIKKYFAALNQVEIERIFYSNNTRVKVKMILPYYFWPN